MVVDTKQAETVILGEQGALAGARPGSLIVIMCTVSASFCKRAAEIAAKKGVGVIDAPVTGGPTGAAAGTLSIMVGGDSRLLEKCRPVLQAMSTNIFHFGSVGQGQVVKAAKNLISVSQYIAISEAVAMVTKAGVDTERFFEMMRTSTGNCWALQGKNWYLWWMRKIAEPETTYLNVKDANLAVDVAKEFGLHLEHLESLPRINLLELLKAVPREVVISHLEEK